MIVYNVIVALVYAFSVRAGLQGLGDILDVRNAVDDRANRPLYMTIRHSVKIDWCKERINKRLGSANVNVGTHSFWHYRGIVSHMHRKDSELHHLLMLVSQIA